LARLDQDAERGEFQVKGGDTVKPLKGLLLLVACLFGWMLFGAVSVFASTVQVGTCLHGVRSYPTISEAVANVPAGSTVKVCPGVYPEQVNIFTPLTLEGISSGNLDLVLITAFGGLASNLDSIFGDPIVAQVMANATGTVNISNITVDGTGNNQNGLVALVGVFYASGTSGTVNGVTTAHQSGNNRGSGIWAENGNSTTQSVTIENCEVHDADYQGIFVGSNQLPPTLTATINGNMINALSFGVYDEAAGSVTKNIIVDVEGDGITVGKAAFNSVLNNSITNSFTGIRVFQSGATVKSNTIFKGFNGFSSGVMLSSSGNATVESNTIKGMNTGIDFACNTGNTVSGNTISDAAAGIWNVPSSQTVLSTYHNVNTIRSGGC
jgi:parallel beta-helix repeat protein